MENTFKNIIPDTELSGFGDISTTANKARALLNAQKAKWDFLRENYFSLSRVEFKSFEINGYTINVQFNAGRIISTSAKVDNTSIQERKCFLCLENLSEEQKGIAEGKYFILCNPYPIFPEHFTISYSTHSPQQILDNFTTMLDLTKKLGEHYTILYNGPKCGASAPDHLHFQAGTKNYTPIEKEFYKIKEKSGINISVKEGVLVTAITGNYLNNFISLESKSKFKLNKIFTGIYNLLKEEMAVNEEPMLNILSSYSYKGWRIIIFPRYKHRPSIYYNAENNLLISPGCVDMCGLLILPRKKDFMHITERDILNIFGEVTVPTNSFSGVIKKIGITL